MKKVCNRCKEAKSLSDFGSKGSGFLRPECRACRNRRDRARWHDRMQNDPKFRERRAEYSRNVRIRDAIEYTKGIENG